MAADQEIDRPSLTKALPRESNREEFVVFLDKPKLLLFGQTLRLADGGQLSSACDPKWK